MARLSDVTGDQLPVECVEELVVVDDVVLVVLDVAPVAPLAPVEPIP